MTEKNATIADKEKYNIYRYDDNIKTVSTTQ